MVLFEGFFIQKVYYIFYELQLNRSFRFDNIVFQSGFKFEDGIMYCIDFILKYVEVCLVLGIEKGQI